MPGESRPSGGLDYDALYEQYMATLTLVGTSECELSHDEAGMLAHDVLVASLPRIGRVPDLQAWLTAAMRAAARTHRISAYGKR
jgi:hypothetical protein